MSGIYSKPFLVKKMIKFLNSIDFSSIPEKNFEINV